MKSSSLFPILATLATSVLTSSSAGAAPRASAPFVRASRRHTVLQFFYLLPAHYFVGSRREKLGKSPVIDRAHDYLETRGEGDSTPLDMAVFRFGGQETVGVFVFHVDGGGELNFYRLRNGRLHDVTRQILPRRLGRQVAELPRRGTTIRVLNRGFSPKVADTLAYNLQWRDGRFVIGRP